MFNEEKAEASGKRRETGEREGTFSSAALADDKWSRGRGTERWRRTGCCRNTWQSFNEGAKFNPMPTIHACTHAFAMSAHTHTRTHTISNNVCK